LKQLQLIQILYVNARDASPVGNKRADTRRVNRVLQARDAGKGGIRDRIPPLRSEKTGIFDGWRFTAR
jgi:hypothetical protein